MVHAQATSGSQSKNRKPLPAQPGIRDNSVGSNQGMGIGPSSTSTQFNNMKQIGAVPGNMSVVGNNKFMGQAKVPVNPNYTVHRMSGGMPNETASRVNELLLEQQKMIYAPPSREKSKQTVRSPMLEKAKTSSIGGQYAPLDEYAAPISNIYQQHTSNTAGG
jgi:hypothetical protein